MRLVKIEMINPCNPRVETSKNIEFFMNNQSIIYDSGPTTRRSETRKCPITWFLSNLPILSLQFLPLHSGRLHLPAVDRKDWKG